MNDRVAGSMILSENRVLRLFSFFLLYFGQGLPLGVSVIAFPAWLAANGASDADVAAIIATAYLPWSFKFIPAAFMDRYAYLPMGRRRAWLVLAQLLMVAGFAIAGFVAPGADDVDVIIYIVFLIGAGSAIQDVAVDGLAVDILPEAEQGTASSFMFGGQTVGRAVSGAAAGAGLQFYGSGATFMFFLPIILAITAYVLLFKERPGERRFPWSAGEASPVNLDRHVGAWWPMAKAAFRSLIKFDSLKLVVAAALSRSAGGMLTTMWPIIAVSIAGFTTASYSSMVSTVDLVMALIAIPVGSFLTTKLGPRVATVTAYTTYAMIPLAVLYGQSFWIMMSVFTAITCWWSVNETLTSICTNPLRMQLSDPTVAATQFTIYNSLSNLPVSFGATLFAVLGGTDNLGVVMWVACALMIAGGVIYSTMGIGSRPVAAEPVPEIN